MGKKTSQKITRRRLPCASFSPIRKGRNINEVLIRWVHENKENPYPTAIQKQILTRKSGKSLKQVNNWFPNTRRSIKKMGVEAWLKKHPAPPLASNMHHSCDQISKFTLTVAKHISGCSLLAFLLAMLFSCDFV